MADAHEVLKQVWAEALSHFQSGRLAEAEAGYRRFLSLMPDHPGASYNLAVTLKGQGRLAEAAAQYRRTLKVRPGNVSAHNNLGVILADQGAAAEAEDHYRRALAIDPDFSGAHFNLARLLRTTGKPRQAIEHFRRALAITPDDADCWNELGIALSVDSQLHPAIEAYRRALALRPEHAEAMNNLGAALVDLDRLEEAIDHYERALGLNPRYADARFNLGHAFELQDRPAEAMAQYELAVALDPAHAQAHHNLGFLLQGQGRPDEALARYLHAQALKADYVDAEWNEALVRLLLGDFDLGWRRYEARWRREGFAQRPLPAPLWDGGELAGRAILLHAEQGLGDAIQFVRYASLVKAKGGTVVLECQRSQLRLFANVEGVERLVAAGEPLPLVDVHAPLLSLPMLLGTTLDTIPADVPYLQADPERVRDWSERLPRTAARRIGLVWRGNPHHQNDRRRSMPLDRVAALKAEVDADWVCLQVDAAPEELAALEPVFDASPRLDDFAETAAAISALDLVVTVDTSVAHLAGALGKPVWLMLPFAPDWRWLTDRSDSPWYPSMRIFRQAAVGDWASVVSDVRAALAGRLEASPAPPRPAQRPRRLPPAMVVSHERSGTHFLMNSLSYGFGYTAQPWTDLDRHAFDIDYADPSAIAEVLEGQRKDPLLRLVKSHHAAAVFGDELARIAEDWRIFYIHRDPAEVMVSFWRHLNALAWDEGPKRSRPLDLAKAAPAGELTRYQAGGHPTMLQRWSAQVEGWLAAAETHSGVTVVRYADLDARYEETLAGLADAVGRAPLTPVLRPPRDVNVIAMGVSSETAPVAAEEIEALRAYCRSAAGPLMTRLGY